MEQILSEISVILTGVLCLFKGVPPPNLAQKDVQSKSYTLLSKLQLESEIPQVSITMTNMSINIIYYYGMLELQHQQNMKISSILITYAI